MDPLDKILDAERLNEDPAHTACRKDVNELEKLVGFDEAYRLVKPYIALSWYGMSYFIHEVLETTKAERKAEDALDTAWDRIDRAEQTHPGVQ